MEKNKREKEQLCWGEWNTSFNKKMICEQRSERRKGVSHADILR